MKDRKAKPTVMIADASPVDAAGTAGLLAGAGFEVAGVHHDGGSLLEALAKAEAPPTLIVMDASLKGASNIAFRLSLKSGLLVLAYPQALARAARLLGVRAAAGLVLKSSPERKLLAATEAVAAGDLYVDGRARLERGPFEARLAPPHAAPGLTAREVAVLKLIAAGLRSRAIASEMGLSARTIESVRFRIRQKLGKLNAAGLTRHAMKIGLLRDAGP
jgi:DNA-binding NarL/FixJ family response regulator